MNSKLKWYTNRLKKMSAKEIAWRLHGELQNRIDKIRYIVSNYRTSVLRSLDHDIEWNLADCGFENYRYNSKLLLESTEEYSEFVWRKQLIKKANKVMEGRMSYFALNDVFHGKPFDYNMDHNTKKKSPYRFSADINYRDFTTTGDCKYVWEPNRHQHLVVLARAYRATGDLCYAMSVKDHLMIWFNQCPFMMGMNWRSPMELSIRLINWVWALDLIKDSGVIDGTFRKSIIEQVCLHIWEVTRKYSRGSSANNHLIGEAAGVFIATSYFSTLQNVKRWREEAKQILHKELFNQTYPDGGTKEQALGYLFFVLQFFIYSGLVARWTKNDFSENFWQRIESCLEFIGRLSEGGLYIPMFGDCDNGYVLDLGDDPKEPFCLLALGATLFNRSDFRTWARGEKETVLWALGTQGLKTFRQIDVEGLEKPLAPSAFKDSGYYLLQSGSTGNANTTSVLFDCGTLGMGAIAAHGHADALSFTLRVNGIDILVDPGSYDYFTYPEWREYFRKTRAHNTVEVDGFDQSEIIGPFMWGRRANAHLLNWKAEPGGMSFVSGWHDGYKRLSDPVRHERLIQLESRTGELTIIDRLFAKKEHLYRIYFHFSEFCTVNELDSHRFRVENMTDTLLSFEIDKQLSTILLSGADNPISGWISRGYHEKKAGMTVIGSIHTSGDLVLKSRIF